MTKLTTLLLCASIAALLGGIVAAAFVVGGSEPGAAPEVVSGPGTASRRVALPLERDPDALMIARHDHDLLVGVAARPGGPVEVSALRAETPLDTKALTFRVGSRAVAASSCGQGCSRLDVPVLDGAPATVSVRTAGSTLDFPLPARLPQSGETIFRRANRTMRALRSFRYTEGLSSGRSGIVSDFAVRAPDRLSFRTSGGFRAVIIGRRRWDLQDGAWKRSSFPGLQVKDLYMWEGASHARLAGHERLAGRPVTVLTLFDREPVTSWFRLFVQPDGRVLQAEMLAPSHFMRHRFRDFDRPLRIEAPRT